MGAIEILWGLAGVATAILFAGWFGMRLERRYKPAAVFFVLGMVPLVAIDIAWAAVTTEHLGSRLVVSGLIGAFAGACLLIAATESLRWLVTGAEAQSVPPNAGPPALPTQTPPPVTITGGDNVVSIGQIGGITARTVTVNPPLKPELRILGREDSDAPDGTHTAVIRTEVVSPISPGLLVLQIQAQDIKNVSVMPPPTGGVSTMNMRNVRKGPNFFSAEIPGPRGQYIITVITAHPTDVRLDASF
jgi:hypothetical protein